MSRNRLATSIVIEWYNATRARHRRSQHTLAALAAQLDEILDDAVALPFALKQPIELIVTYNSDVLQRTGVESTVRSAMPHGCRLEVKLAPVSGGTCCEQKNHGAAISSGDIIISLDSGVVPEPGWLAAILTAFGHPEVEAVIGNTFLDCSDGRSYSRALALTWMFPLASTLDRRVPARDFYANNLDLRKHIFQARPFDDVPGLMHAAARQFVSRLDPDQITLWTLGNARALHPPRNGFFHFIKRAVAGSRAGALDPTSP